MSMSVNTPSEAASPSPSPSPSHSVLRPDPPVDVTPMSIGMEADEETRTKNDTSLELVIEYLLYNGHEKAVLQLLKANGGVVKPTSTASVLFNSMRFRKQIMDLIRMNYAEKALNMCEEQYPGVIYESHDVLYLFQSQIYLNYIKLGKWEAAMEYVQKQDIFKLSSSEYTENTQYKSELEDLLSVLAYDEISNVPEDVRRKFFSKERTQLVVQQVNACIIHYLVNKNMNKNKNLKGKGKGKGKERLSMSSLELLSRQVGAALGVVGSLDHRVRGAHRWTFSSAVSFAAPARSIRNRARDGDGAIEGIDEMRRNLNTYLGTFGSPSASVQMREKNRETERAVEMERLLMSIPSSDSFTLEETIDSMYGLGEGEGEGSDSEGEGLFGSDSEDDGEGEEEDEEEDNYYY